MKLCYIAVLALFLCLVLPKIDQPITDDEVYQTYNVEKLLSGDKVHPYVPSFYDWILAPCVKFFGPSAWAFRIPGVISGALSILLLMAIGRALFPENNSVPCASALLLAVNPAFVQGALLVHADNTILAAAILLWLYCLLKYLKEKKEVFLYFSALFLAVSLFVKFSTPVIIIPATILFIRIKQRELLPRYLLLTALSILAFLAGWKLLSQAMGVSFSVPFCGAYERLGIYMGRFSLSELAKDFMTLCVWFTPYLVLGVIMSFGRILRGLSDTEEAVSLLGLSGMFVLIYFFISTVNHGYPKYYIPALPLFIIALVGYIGKNEKAGKEDLKRICVLVLFFAIYFLVLAKDPVHLVRYRLREVLITGTGKQELIKTLFSQSLIYMIPFFAYYFFRNVNFRTFLLVLVFSMGLSLSAKQAISDYQTNYSYGETKTMEVDEYLRKNSGPGDGIIATKDVLSRLGRNGSYFSMYFWKDKGRFLETVRRKNVKFLVVSIPSQSADFYRTIMDDPEVKDLLAKDFREVKIGTYTVYERK